MDSEKDWPMDKRVSDALDLFERSVKCDPLFRPSPFQVAASLSAAREALKVLVERSK
jgi:hypothetical protein